MRVARALIAALLSGAGLPSHGEVIDGPANVRVTPNGSPAFSLMDGKQVSVKRAAGAWRLVAVEIEQPRPSLAGNAILAGHPIVCRDGVECGKSLAVISINDAQASKEGVVRGTIEGYTHANNLKRIKLSQPSLKNIRDAYYLAPSLVNERKRIYSIQSAWESPPYAAEASIKRKGDRFHISIGDLHSTVIEFAIDKEGVVDRPPCMDGTMCVSEISIPDKDRMYIVIYGVKYQFVNVQGMKQTVYSTAYRRLWHSPHAAIGRKPRCEACHAPF